MIDAHRGAFEYDWRTRFHKSLRVIGRSMSWGEADRLVQLLIRDTSSQVCAAVTGWRYPVSRAELVAMDHYDAFAKATYKKPQPYPRPWDKPPKRFGSGVSDVAAVLAAHRQAVDAERLKRDARGRLRDARGRFVKEPTQPEGGLRG